MLSSTALSYPRSSSSSSPSPPAMTPPSPPSPSSTSNIAATPTSPSRIALTRESGEPSTSTSTTPPASSTQAAAAATSTTITTATIPTTASLLAAASISPPSSPKANSQARHRTNSASSSSLSSASPTSQAASTPAAASKTRPIASFLSNSNIFSNNSSGSGNHNRPSRSYSLISPLLHQSLPPQQPSGSPTSLPASSSRQHLRQLSAEHAFPSSQSSSISRDLQHSNNPLLHLHHGHHHHHQRQHTYPQSPGPTSTTLAQSPHRRLNNSGSSCTQLSSHRSSPTASPAAATGTSSLSPSPSFSLQNSTTHIPAHSTSSPRYHVDNSSNSTATTLPPLPFFPPLPFSPDLLENINNPSPFPPVLPSSASPSTFSSSSSSSGVLSPVFVASEQEQQQQQQQQQQQHQQEEQKHHHHQGLSVAGTNTNKDTRTTTNTGTIAIPPSSLEPQELFSPPSSPPQQHLRPMTGILAHSPHSSSAAAARSGHVNASLHSIPIPTRPGLAHLVHPNNSSNCDHNHSSTNANGSKGGLHSMSSISSTANRANSNSDLQQQNYHQRRDSNSSGYLLLPQLNNAVSTNGKALFLTPNSSGEGSSVKSESSYLSSRRSSKDSCDSTTTGTSIEDLVDQMTVPDYANPHEQMARTKVFLLIYRKFMRPSELLEMFIARFEALGDYVDDEDAEANNTRIRICSCLYYWLKNHPNDILHRQTRQRVAAFLRDRVALFPCLSEMYLKLVPFSSIHYFNTWRWPHADHSADHAAGFIARSSSSSAGGGGGGGGAGSGGVSVSSVSDEDEDSGYHDTNSIHGEEDMDEDREWGMVDEDNVVRESGESNSGAYGVKNNPVNLDSLAAFAHLAALNTSNINNNGSGGSVAGNRPHIKTLYPNHIPARDRRSSTGSFAQAPSSACAMETFVAGRRGSASSVSSNPGPFSMTSPTIQYQLPFGGGTTTPSHHSGFAEGEGLMIPALLLQPIGSIPFINKRSSSQAYRQQRSHSHLQNTVSSGSNNSTASPLTPPLSVSSALSSSSSVTGSEAETTPGAGSTVSGSVPIHITAAAASTATTTPASAATAAALAGVHSSNATAATTTTPIIVATPALAVQPSSVQSSHSWIPSSLSTSSSSSSSSDISGPMMAAVTRAALLLKDTLDEKIHPFGSHHHHHHGKSGHQQQQSQRLSQQHQHPHHHSNPWAPSSNSSPVVDYTAVNIPFMEIKDGAIAEQLTCVEYGLFKKLKPRDMLRQVWKTKKGSAAFQACIAHFNFISSWVGTMILLPPKTKHRAKMMEKFISIAKILRDMGNYNTTMAIIGALNTSSIHRLVQTRELLQGKEIWTTFKELEHLMSSERSFFEYRSALRATKSPCIPYLGVHLGDLLSISEGNKDFRPQQQVQGHGQGQEGVTATTTTTITTSSSSSTAIATTTTTTATMHLHWQKFVLMTDVISMVMAFQQEVETKNAYHRIKPDPFISRVITDTHVLDDEELYTKSVGTEPGKLNHSRSLSKFTFF